MKAYSLRSKLNLNHITIAFRSKVMPHFVLEYIAIGGDHKTLITVQSSLVSFFLFYQQQSQV